MQKVRDYSRLIARSKALLLVLFSSIIISLFIIIPMLPYAVGQNLLDLKFGFQRDDVGLAFSILGEEGKRLSIFVSLILDTIFPIVYVSFHLGIYHYSNYKNNFIYSVPLLTGAFDLMENIQCAMIMSIPSIESVSDQQIVLASGTNQVKWLLVFTMITIAIFPILKKGYRKLRKSFLRRYLFYTKKEKFVFRLNDILLNLDIRDSIDREIYFTNRYEEEQIKLLLDNIKKLRELTSVGFKDCKLALDETNGDIEKSIEFLRKKGIAKASKKMSRTASEGLALASSAFTNCASARSVSAHLP